MSKPARQALVLWMVGLGLAIAVLFGVLGPPRSSDGAGEALGRLLALTGCAALASWLLARNREPEWTWLRFGLVYAAAIVVIAVISSFGRASAAEPWPFSISFPAGWSVARLEGVSSAAEDLDRGVRTRGRRDDEAGTVILEIGCTTLVEGKSIDIAGEMDDVIEATDSAFEAQGIVSESARPVVEKHAGLGWRIAETTSRNAAGTQVRRTLAMSRNAHCLLVATMVGTPRAHDLQRGTFRAVLDSLVDRRN
ncbi:protein of unknown function [Dokdonella immobilis]|uniref:Uncharacterized protein n=2 Tax=Dokdonella immobilis TaxID=578942 RepID=A0A1I5AS57_9GAMM|nr:protein of unknown function [Dokdonella immobilis]